MREIRHITWDQQFSVHVGELDAQHRKLFDITNRMVDICKSNSRGRLKILEELVEYTNIHFRTEKTFMINTRYPAFQEHMQEHGIFINKTLEFLQGLVKQEERLSQDIAGFLLDWIYTHTMSSDLQLGEHILRAGYKQ